MKRICQAGILAAAVLVLLGVTALNHQSQKLQRYEGQFLDCFDTVTIITGYDTSQEAFTQKMELLEEKLRYYHQLYDIYHTYDGMNNMKTINDAAGQEAVEVNEDIMDLLKLGRQMYVMTDGKLHIAYGSVLSLWHEYREEGVNEPENAKLPPQEELAKRAEHTNMDFLFLDEEASTVYLADAEMSLDVGSIGKGFAVQKLAEYAREIGMEHVLISVGGNVCAVGGKADGTPWVIGVENPDTDSDEAYLATVELSDGCLVTSGDYQRYYEVEGQRYCHIIDPDTNMPPAYFSSVSVQTKDSGTADALSTALFNMRYERGLALVEKLQDVEAMWIGKDGKISYSSGFETNEKK